MQVLTTVVAFVVLVLTFAAADAQSARKSLQGMSSAERRQFIKEGGLAGKCKYDRCYSKCMEKRGIDQWSNAKCAERCARGMGCV